jgi:hypothetical protein
MCGFIVMLTSCSKGPVPIRNPYAPDLELSSVLVRSYSNGQLKAVTRADRLEVFRESGTPGELVAHDAGVDLASDGTHLTAPLVRGNFMQGQLLGEGGVAMRTPQGLEGRTPRVWFDRNAGEGGQASSDAGVWLSQPQFELTADGFVMDLSSQHATFDGVIIHFNQTNDAGLK